MKQGLLSLVTLHDSHPFWSNSAPWHHGGLGVGSQEPSQVVTSRSDELDGDHYEFLTPAAEALAAKYPLAATLVLRAMIDFALGAARSKRYRHVARHLLECESLSTQITDFGNFASHDAYLAALKIKHGRKQAFWRHVE